MIRLARPKAFKNSEILAVIAAIAIAFSFSVFDIVYDIKTGSTVNHLVIDFSLSLAMLAVLVTLLTKVTNSSHRFGSLQTALNQSQREVEDTKLRAEQLEARAVASEKIKARFQQGLADFIDYQFEEWQLSAAEKEIALLLMKGLSHQEISVLRSTSERTVRQQSLSIYKKADVKGRSDLAAFFLEDLLSPPSETSS